MSIEKLRADTCDFDDEDCKKCQQAKILHALLDEHQSEHDQTDLALRNERHDKAQELIEKYGEVLQEWTTNEHRET